MVLFSFPSPKETGWAAPIWVLGAMTAIWAAMVMKTPAEAALAPRGPTYTTTGTLEVRIFLTMILIDSIKSPGVSSSMIRHWAFCWVA